MVQLPSPWICHFSHQTKSMERETQRNAGFPSALQSFWTSVCWVQRDPTTKCHMKKLPPPVGTLLFGTGTKPGCASALSWSNLLASKKGEILIQQRCQLQGLILPHQIPYESWILFDVQSRVFQMNGYDWNEIGTRTCLLLQSLAFPSWIDGILK